MKMLVRPLQKTPDFSGWESAYKMSKSYKLFIDSTHKIYEPLKEKRDVVCMLSYSNEWTLIEEESKKDRLDLHRQSKMMENSSLSS